MSSSDNAEHASRASKAVGGKRTGIAMPVEYVSTNQPLHADPSDTPLSMFTPYMNMASASIKGLMSSPKAKAHALPVEDSFAVWQEGDLGSGRKRLLIATSPTHAVQVYAFSSSIIPDDPHVPESFPAPHEVVSIPELVYDRDVQQTVVPGVTVKKPSAPKRERTLSAHLLDKALWGQHGPVVALTVGRSSVTGQLAVVLVSLQTGKVFRRLELGPGVAANVTSSARAIVVTTTHPSPSIHVLDRKLVPISVPITDLPVNPRTRLPVASIAGRLVAFTTREAAATPGADGLGSIYAASSTRLRSASAGSAHLSPPPQSAQNALLTSAVEIGSGVARSAARGVWAGLKIGAQVASDRLAKSAPTERADALPRDEYDAEEAGESRSVEDSVAPVENLPPPGGVWVKIVDMFPRGHDQRQPVLIAHFRLPPSPPRSMVSPGQIPAAVAREYPVAYVSFSPDGSRLFAAAADGRDFHVLDIRPDGANVGKRGPAKGDVWHAYVLRRGNTSAEVCDVEWSHDERWISVSTAAKGTIHVFPISPAGGKPVAASHVPVRFPNPPQMQPLSVEVAPYARLRPQSSPSSEDLAGKAGESLRSYAVASFALTRRHPITKGILCQDLVIYRPSVAQMELARLTIHAAAPPGLPASSSSSHASAARRRASGLTSNLTAAMREKRWFRPDGDLDVEQALKARWAIPVGQGPPEPAVLAPARATPRPPPAGSSRSLYHAEIRTHSSSPRILPATIYLSHQVEFFAAVPTDEFSPLSVLDKVARTRRLVFRPEVEIRPTSDARSFDEPLNSALHSVIESSQLAPQIPQLPNGMPSGSSRWSSVPRNVAQGLGEGVDRFGRLVAAHAHQRRRKINAAGESLSFEDDTVFPPRLTASESDDLESSPSSLLPTNTDSSLGGGDLDDNEWNDKWEDEYRKAVEEDSPDDFLVGIMDEEQSERQKWEARQKELEREYQKPEKKKKKQQQLQHNNNTSNSNTNNNFNTKPKKTTTTTT